LENKSCLAPIQVGAKSCDSAEADQHFARFSILSNYASPVAVEIQIFYAKKQRFVHATSCSVEELDQGSFP
jgi:hypothetical protein